jgi:hypothetical protein
MINRHATHEGKAAQKGLRRYALCQLSVFCLGVAQPLTSCSSVPYLPPAQARLLADGQIKVGVSRADVINQLGAPERQEMRGATEFLFYRLAWQFAAYADERNPIAIKDGKVIGLGKAYYDSISSVQADAKSLPPDAKAQPPIAKQP